MTNPVGDARARAQAALARWREARAAVTNPDPVPDRLDEIVAVAERTIAVIGQDIVTEVEAIVVELAAVRFSVEPDDALGALETATLALDGALGRLSRAASQAGFAAGEHDLNLPPGVRVPAEEIAKELEAFAAAVEGVRLVLERIARAQAAESSPDAKQEALVRNVIEKLMVKIEIIGIKTVKISLIDMTGLATVVRELGRLLRSFVSTVRAAASQLSDWLSQEAPGWIRPVLAPLARGAAQIARGAAAWIKRSKSNTDKASKGSSKSSERTPPVFDIIELERTIERGGVPPPNMVPFVTSFDLGAELDQKAVLALGHMKALRELTIFGYQVNDLSPLATLTALHSLHLDYTQVSDLTPLAGLIALKSLSLRGTRVCDLSPLAGLAALQELNFDGTQVSDLSPLAGLTGLRYLDFRGTNVRNLAPLKALHNLEAMGIEENEALIATLGLPAEWTGHRYVIKRTR